MNGIRSFRWVTALLVIFSSLPNDASAARGVGQSLGDGESANHVSHELTQARETIERVRKGDVTLQVQDARGRPLAGVQLRVDQVSQDFLFGALSDGWMSPKFTPAESGRFQEQFTNLFNFTIAKVYWSGYERQQGRPDWPKLDEFLNWCRENHLKVKGHPLGWTHPAGTPGWLLASPDEIKKALYRARIYDLVGGNQGRVDMWDVVNEPVTTVPWEWAMKDAQNPREGIGLGGRYEVSKVTQADIVPWVERSFHWADEANPNGDFILNEFFLIAKPEVRKKFLALTNTLLDRGVPVRGIGIQAHEPQQMWFSPQQVKETLDELAALKLPLHITEFTPQSAGLAIEGWRGGAWNEEAQADFAEQMYTQAFGHPAVASISWWGFNDRDAWLKNGGLVDTHLNPKPVYLRLQKLIRTEWMTKGMERETDASGGAKLRGFYGGYRVEVVTPDGTVKPFQFQLKEGGENLWTIKL